MRSFNLDTRFDAIVTVFSGIGYLTEESDLRRAVMTMASHLRPGGLLLLEGSGEPDEWLRASVSADSFQPRIPVAHVTASDEEGLRSSFASRYIVATLDGISTIDERPVLRLSDPEEFESACQEAGLTFERLPSFLRPGRSVYVGVAAR